MALHGVFREVLVVLVAGGLTGVDAHPREVTTGCVRGGFEHFLCGRTDVGPDTVPVDDRDNRVFRNVEFVVLRDRICCPSSGTSTLS